ncbi:hypothetical protein KBC79_03820, partial [Candidatus Woesebacteria bacterium]|nr:hypothetical protein [Candidatus Woesebacteria bacterium]
LVMIFNHYGISRLPDETILTPGSLNHWLQNQPDGYVGEGLVSWSAALRVAQASHNRYGTPLLAYRKTVENIDATVQAELTAHRPFILQLPGHFVVGQGLVSTEPFDVRIADPLGQITQLNQQTHQPLSVRTFVPTTTPNPLILSISDQDTSVRFTDESGNNAGVTSIDFINSSTDSAPHTSTPRNMTELIPLNSQYSLHLSKPVFGYTATSLFGYDSYSLLTNQQIIRHVVGPLGIRFLLTYPVGDNQMTIKSLANFEELMLDLEPLSQDTQLSPPLKWALQELFSVASNQQNKSRYVSLSEQFLSERPVGTTSLGLEYLHQQLLAIEQY